MAGSCLVNHWFGLKYCICSLESKIEDNCGVKERGCGDNFAFL